MPEPRVLVIVFDDTEAEVRCSLEGPLSRFYAITDAYDPALTFERTAMATLFDLFAPVLVSWSYQPPATREGMEEMDPNVTLAIIREWIFGVRSAPLPLARRSIGGAPSPVASPSEGSPEPTPA